MDLRKDDGEGYCKVKLDSLITLKDSTKKLLCLIEDLETKANPKEKTINNYATAVTKLNSPSFTEEDIISPLIKDLANYVTDLPTTCSMKDLEDEINEIDNKCIMNEHDCSVYKRLARKCSCMNKPEYNDLIIHFNELTKYRTSNLGEIIKNMRILKKFVYMGGDYTKNALIFLNEGLTKCPHIEKVEIVTACSHADLCNVFDDDSYIRILIRTPNKYEEFGDAMTQSLAARVLYRIAMVEEGRRYLNFNSKIANDIKEVLRKLSGKLNDDTKEFLNSTLDLLDPLKVPLVNATYYCKADEGMTNKILNALTHFRRFMTFEEILANFELLNKLGNYDQGINDLKANFTDTCRLFKTLLIQYDHTRLNILITRLMNKLVKAVTKEEKVVLKPKTFLVSDTLTEPTAVLHKFNQVPSIMLKNIKKNVKSKYMKNINKSQKSFRSVRSTNHSKILSKPWT